MKGRRDVPIDDMDDSLTLLLANSRARMMLAKRMPQPHTPDATPHIQTKTVVVAPPPPPPPAVAADPLSALREALQKHGVDAAAVAASTAAEQPKLLIGYADYVERLLSGTLAAWVARGGLQKVKAE